MALVDAPTNQFLVPDCLRLDRCPDCGYLLTGLPPEGRCPECGFSYRQDIVVLYGWAVGRHARVDNARPWRAVWLGFAGVLVLSFQWLPTIISNRWLIVGLLLLACATLGWALWRRRELTIEGCPPVQLRFQAEGFGQRDGAGPLRLQEWERGLQITIGTVRRGRVRVLIERPLAWWKFHATDGRLVEFEFEAPEERAGEVRDVVQHFRSTSRSLERT